MRTDVKIALVASIVLIILIIVYIALVHHPRKTVMQNTEASSAPPLVQSNNPAPSQTSSVSNSSLASHNTIGGAANVPANPIQVPAGTATTTASPVPSTAPVSPSTSMVDNGTLGHSVGTTTAPSTENSLADSQGAGNTGVTTGTSGNGGNTGNGLKGGNSSGLTGNIGQGGSSAAGSSGNSIPSLTFTTRHQGGGGYYRIRQGDTLVGISRRIYGTTTMVTAIEAANPGVSARDLRIGEKIRLPRKTHRPAANYHSSSYHPAQRHPVTGDRIYIVRRGDTLYSIAQHVYHNGGDWKLIYRANRRKLGSNPSDIFGGERLVIPAR